MQAAPSLRLETKEYVSLAEKALTACGMAPAVWLLVQLHQAHAISFYQLPSHTAAVMSHPSAKGASAAPTSALTVGDRLPGGLAPALSDDSKARVQLKVDKVEAGHWEENRGEAAGGKRTCSTVTLFGVSVDVAIIVVLSWAAQLAQLEATPGMMQNGNITFELGE